MNITTKMLQALETQIGFLQGMILNSVNAKVSTDEFKKRKTQLELLLEECQKTEIKTEINSINLDEKIDPMLVEHALSKLVHKGKIKNTHRDSITELFEYNHSYPHKESIYKSYTWRIFYETFYHHKQFLTKVFLKSRPKTAEAIIFLLEELGLPELIE